jgi:hypothetical protein
LTCILLVEENRAVTKLRIPNNTVEIKLLTLRRLMSEDERKKGLIMRKRRETQLI